ncbi:MAG: DNA polymerase Y family protein, partial [Rhodospirillales bacterium]|nr:DNA polymerase Y family protein [Acetobacter sp.]
MNEALFVCLRVPEFAAQALVRLRPPLVRAAVAVLEGDPPLEKTCAATLQARRLGVRHGMTRGELESFPQLTLMRRSRTEEQSAALALVEAASRFTPRIEELPRTSAYMLVLDMSGTTRLLGSPQAICQKVFRAARELGFFVRVASSQNVQTAACLVRAPG